MEKAILSGILLAPVVESKAQGTILFQNLGVEIFIDSPRSTPSDFFVVSLYLEGQIEPLATTGFLAGTGFIDSPDQPVVVPGHPEGSTDSVFVVRAYEAGKTYETTSPFLRVSSSTFTVGPLGGPNTAPPSIDNLQSMVIPTPEPSSITLGLFGLAALASMGFRRSSKSQGAKVT